MITAFCFICITVTSDSKAHLIQVDSFKTVPLQQHHGGTSARVHRNMATTVDACVENNEDLSTEFTEHSF
jgi:hypothetical protein